MAAVFGTASDDIVIPTVAGADYRGAQGNDTYLLTNLIPGGSTIVITDTEGTNRVQLADGLSIASSSFLANAVELTLSNGAKVQILNASAYIYDIGANATSGDLAAVPNQTYAQFAAALGVATLPTGAGSASGGAFTVPTALSAPTFEITDNTVAGSVDEGSSVTFTLETTNVAAGSSYSWVLSGTGISAGDVGGVDRLTGMVTIGSDGMARITVPVSADGSLEGAETLRLTVAGIEHTVTINDTSVPSTAGQTFNAVSSTVLGVQALRVTGDMDVRIDMTTNPNQTSQITGLDLDGDGGIEADGVENAMDVWPTTGNVVVDAYTRLVNGVVNETDLTSVFLGDIDYDGTGWAGDGVDTDGNIVLGGLGADTILGGIGNDFLAGGGVALSRGVARDVLSGGRNADWFFTELSLLSNTDGNGLSIDGGTTADDTSAGSSQSAQDRDWLLPQASDDDEPVEISLGENPVPGAMRTRAGQSVSSLLDIENVDASGNLYGFLRGLDTQLGGAPSGAGNPNNSGIGSSAQLDIAGSTAANILIGGYDNDVISGGGGNDILMGGNLNMLIDPNLVGLVGGNDGRDELYGDGGDDHITFETDSGVIDGGANDTVGDTLWLTAKTLGNTGASVLAADATIRIDLGASVLAVSSGYGGADLAGSQDQTKYGTVAGNGRVQVDAMEHVIATGLGAIDYLAAGSNDPELNFDNQQNFDGYAGKMQLRGQQDTTSNTLYANTGDDLIEGRGGDDFLSGGDGKDDFVFQIAGTGGTATGDGVDVIHRQNDANNNKIWDGTGVDRAAGDSADHGTFGRDFKLNGSSIFGPSSLSVDFAGANLADANVWMGSFSLKIGTTTFAITDLAGLKLIDDVASLATFVNAAFHAQDPNVVVTSVGTVLTITDNTSTATSGGRVMSVTQPDYNVNLTVQAPGAGALTLPVFVPAGSTPAEDRLIFAAYEDRADGELVDDNGFVNHTGDAVTLGTDGYAEDLVVRFGSTGSSTHGSTSIGDTVIAEDQTWTATFTNLADEDTVSLSVNGTAFSLQMGVAANGTALIETDAQFVARLASFINSVADANTLAGSLIAANVAGTTVLTLTQGVGGGAGGGAGQNVFMDRPMVTLGNGSGGEPATVAISKTGTDTEITLADFDGRNGELTARNVLFVGGSGMNEGAVIADGLNAESAAGVANANSRSVLATAAAAGGTLNGSNALVLDSMTDADALATDFSLHGDDYLLGGAGPDNMVGGTGDDRFEGSAGADTVNGGKDLYVVTRNVAGVPTESVETLNTYDAAQRRDTTIVANADVLSVVLLEEDSVTGATDGFTDALVFNQNSFASPATTNFYVTVGRAADAARLQQMAGGEGVVQVGSFNSQTSVFTQTQGATAFSEMEAIRTLAGDGTRAGQGRDTVDVSLISNDVAASFATAAAANAVAAGVTVNLMSNTSAITVVADLNGVDADNLPSETIANFLAVAGVENVVGGAANDTVNIDESEVRKDNTFTGGAHSGVLSNTVAGLVGDVMVYNHSDMDNDGVLDLTTKAAADAAIAALAAAQAVLAPLTPLDAGYAAALAAVVAATGPAATGSAYYARPSVNLKIGTATDLVTMSGGTMLSDSPVDTLNDVEGIDLNDLARSSLRDTLDTTSIAGATINFGIGKVLQGATLLVDIGDMTELENTKASVTGADTVLPADTMTNNNAVAWTTDLVAPVGTDPNNSFAFFRGAVNTVPMANQGLFDFDFGTGTGASNADIINYANELNQDIMVVLDLSGAGVDRVVVADPGAGDIDGDLSLAGARVDILRGADIYMPGGADAQDSGIDLSQHTGDLLTVSFSSNATALNALGGTGEDQRFIQIVDGTTSIVKQFIDNGLTTAERAAILALTTTADAAGHYWNRIEGNDRNEFMSLTDRESDHAIRMNLQGGANTVSYEADSIGNTLNFADIAVPAAGIASQQVLTVDLTTSFVADGVHTHTITGDIGSQRIMGSGTGDDVIDLSAVTASYSIILNIIEGSGLKGTVTINPWDVNGDEDFADVGIDLLGQTTTVVNYEDLIGNNQNNTYQSNSYINNITAGTGNDNFIISNFDDVTGDTWDAGAGTDTVSITSGVTTGAYVFTLNNGTADQLGGNTADLLLFENVDASGVTSASATFTMTGRNDVASTLRGGAGIDTLTSAFAGSILDGGAGADALDFGAAATTGWFEFGDSNGTDATTDDTLTNFTSGTDRVRLLVDMAARSLTNVSAAFGTGTTPTGAAGAVTAYYDTTNTQLLVDMDASGTFATTGDLTLDSATAVAAGDISYWIKGSSSANTISGGASTDLIRGGGGADAISVVDQSAMSEVQTVQLGLTVATGASFLNIGTGPVAIALVAGDTADTIAAKVIAAQAAIRLDADVLDPGLVISYDSTTTRLTFTHTAGLLVGDLIDIATGDATFTPGLMTEVTNGAAAVSAADDVHYVSASEGGDTITGFVSGTDRITFEATTGGNPSGLTSAIGDQIDDSDLGIIGFQPATDALPAAAEAIVVGAEALLIDAANNGTFASATLTDLTAVAALFQANFTLAGTTAASDALLVLESDTVGTYGVYFWDSSAANDVFDAAELTLIAVVTADALATGDFALVAPIFGV